MSDLDLALIGNCSVGALIDGRGRIVWSCFPRFDGDPVFCSLVNGNGDQRHGYYEIELIGHTRSEQRYRRNSAIVVTTLHDGSGGSIEITDFAPRFKQYDRVFRPTTLVRLVKPLSGRPRVRIRLRPACNNGADVPERTRGSNHLRFVMPTITLRLTTDVPVTFIQEETPFILERPVTMVLGPDESLTESVATFGRSFCERTDAYWLEWCRYLALPFEWQEAVIRAAITLKLCSYEETGAIVAAVTTSIPESPDTTRNWDYRYCWLRDSYFVVNALNHLGVTRTMEGYLDYLANIVAGAEDGYLQPVYGIGHERGLVESDAPALAGYRGMGPVRLGNEAYAQIQNDGYGSVILASAQVFFDHRLNRLGDEAMFQRLELVGEQAVRRWNQPDAGLWEFRTRADVHTFSSVMCWAACDRLARIAAHLGLRKRERHWRGHADLLRKEILAKAWNESLNSFVATFEGELVDASLLLMRTLGFVTADDPRYLGTLALIEKRLLKGDFLYRYATEDDFGAPESAFNVCTFWYIDALASVGRETEARRMFETMLSHRNSVGLLSEDIDPRTGELWGNFPQTYSMVGLIHSALMLSKPWEDAF